MFLVVRYGAARCAVNGWTGAWPRVPPICTYAKGGPHRPPQSNSEGACSHQPFAVPAHSVSRALPGAC
uniref:Predicted protein n=1 Tax=Hordeum vulgare subsp. vulgare TaxID=112509 RepID=F2D445_HORVV|nr:predicted protein [Hordeum vulgare subsp. vulgare]